MTGTNQYLLPRSPVASACDLWPKFRPSSTWYLLQRVEPCGALAKPSRQVSHSSASPVQAWTQSLKGAFSFPSQCHYAVTPSHQGCPSKRAARPQVRPPRNAGTARCGQRPSTSIRRAHSPPKRSRDRRFSSFFCYIKKNHKGKRQKQQKRLFLFIFQAIYELYRGEQDLIEDLQLARKVQTS